MKFIWSRSANALVCFRQGWELTLETFVCSGGFQRVGLTHLRNEPINYGTRPSAVDAANHAANNVPT